MSMLLDATASFSGHPHSIQKEIFKKNLSLLEPLKGLMSE
jgi:hypothetical protein